MEKKYLMGNRDFLTRSIVKKGFDTSVSVDLLRRLREQSIKNGLVFYCNFFNKDINSFNASELNEEYQQHLTEGKNLGLFSVGGVREKDHLNYWLLSKVLDPQVYVESGVFIGSSLHAFISGANEDVNVVAIDPNMGKLKLSEKELPKNHTLIDDRDFESIDFELNKKENLVYFDDHINSALRIISAKEKGFKYVLFDDSSGLEGICQRLYPPFPTVPIILNVELFKVGDTLNWSWKYPNNQKQPRNLLMSRKKKENSKIASLNVSFSDELIDLCYEAKSAIKRVDKIPDLGELIPQKVPEKMNESSKYLIELFD